MTTRAKFKCDEIKRSLYGPEEMHTVVLMPVYGGGSHASADNRAFWQATPSGRVELGCINLEAAKMFELGKCYYLDFSPAE
jgi:hypothetical protein